MLPKTMIGSVKSVVSQRVANVLDEPKNNELKAPTGSNIRNTLATAGMVFQCSLSWRFLM